MRSRENGIWSFAAAALVFVWFLHQYRDGSTVGGKADKVNTVCLLGRDYRHGPLLGGSRIALSVMR